MEEQFREANMAHILAVSGMHISYLIIGCVFFLKTIFGKRMANIITCMVIIIYMLIVGLSSSITRAGIMGILMLMSSVVYRKNDVYTNMSFSLLVMLLINPYLIIDVGLQISYAGTLGIIIFRKNILFLLKKIKVRNQKIKYKIPKILKRLAEISAEIISVTLSVQIFILPISVFHFNLFSTYFIITNFFISIIIGPVFIIGILYTILNSRIILKLLEFGIRILIEISKIPQFLVGSKIYLSRPNFFQIIIYYIFIFIIFYIISLKKKLNKNMSEKRILNLIALFKFNFRKINKEIKLIFILCLFLSFILINLIPQKLKINFIDVGQGDSTFITTPNNKTILIDGGGSYNSKFDVGRSIVLPYILNHGYNKLDYIMISHMDLDHIRRIIYNIRRNKCRRSYYCKTS